MPGIQRETTFRFLAQPTDVNFGGKVHGGMVMKWIDQAGYAAAVGWSGQYCVTVAVGGIQFVKPILIGDIVVVRCKLIRTGASSMHFSVDVIARDLKTASERLATHCVISFVALDAPEGRPTAVPRWEPRTPEDEALEAYAVRVMELSRQLEAEIRRVREMTDGD
ncbi:acyl-CoA thioesterase [Tahibacter amnicola]|uniref:Acyl-CoA thioesterase n=1 Tax=Tahibacter amnicola TaxID=2976241 RepID=A0ABY6BDU2_9GAMM|nr:acyl-CoA thioesterase [Tahibacter amnicola]UXI67408.1 acyl-CoA thioesterase [Tahibacter amnicola]